MLRQRSRDATKSDRDLTLRSNSSPKANVLIEGYRPGVWAAGIGSEKMCEGQRAGWSTARMTGWGKPARNGLHISFTSPERHLHAIGPATKRPVPATLNLVGDFGGGTDVYWSASTKAAMRERETPAERSRRCGDGRRVQRADSDV